MLIEEERSGWWQVHGEPHHFQGTRPWVLGAKRCVSQASCELWPFSAANAGRCGPLSKHTAHSCFCLVFLSPAGTVTVFLLFLYIFLTPEFKRHDWVAMVTVDSPMYLSPECGGGHPKADIPTPISVGTPRICNICWTSHTPFPSSCGSGTLNCQSWTISCSLTGTW